MDLGIALSLLVTVVLLLLGVEIVVCLGLGAVLLTAVTGVFTLENVSMAAFQGLNSFPLIAMPLYILTGDLIGESGIAKMLTNFSRAVLGWLKGGLALTTLLACGFFAAISGSNSATVATMGKIMLPEMKKDGYPTDFAAATAAYGGTVGIIIPPSIIFIIYGVSTGTPVGDLFLGGIIPGFLMVACMCVGAFYLSRRHNWGGKFPFSARNVLRSAWDAKLAFGASAIILGGIYGGVFTPSEAGAIAVAYCLLVGVLITRGIKIRKIPEVTERSATINGFVAPIVAMAIVFSQILSFLQLPQNGVKALLALSENEMIIVGLMLVVLLIAGCVMECTPNVILLAPLLTPVATQLGFDPVHWGVVMVVTLAIGFITPPVGLNLYVASGISGMSFTRIAARGSLYFLGLLVALLLITSMSQLSLWLVRR